MIDNHEGASLTPKIEVKAQTLPSFSFCTVPKIVVTQVQDPALSGVGQNGEPKPALPCARDTKLGSVLGDQVVLPAKSGAPTTNNIQAVLDLQPLKIFNSLISEMAEVRAIHSIGTELILFQC